MFARYFVEIQLPPRQVEDLLTRDPEAWLPGLAQHAHHRGDQLLADVGFGHKTRVARAVSITVGHPVRTETKLVLPIRWVPTGATGLFPSLEADLEIASLGSDDTQLAISARYAPPLRAVGRMIDRVVLARVAEATLKDFLDGLALAVLAGAGDEASTEPSPQLS